MGSSINEWGKGISFFFVVTLLFYFLWENIFSNIIEFVGSDLFNLGVTASTDLAILKTIAWVSFILLWLSTGGIYLIYSFIAGSKSDSETHPIEFLKAIGLWSIFMPILSLVYAIIVYLTTNLDPTLTETASRTMASNFSWILALLVLLILTIVPFYYVLKGYGVIENSEEKKVGGTE